MAPRKPAARRTDPVEGAAALARSVAALDAGGQPERADLRTATRYLLEEFAAQSPGRAVEVRVPPYAAVQCLQGPRHTRGTPPNVVETDPITWLRLATGRTSWREAEYDGRLRASGERSDVSGLLPVAPA